MLDEKDLQAIAQLMDGKLETAFKPINKRLDQMQEESGKINVALENRVFPQLEALAEGQKTILETLAPKNRVEALEDEVSFLKQMIKTLASEVNELKKAQ